MLKKDENESKNENIEDENDSDAVKDFLDKKKKAQKNIADSQIFWERLFKRGKFLFANNMNLAEQSFFYDNVYQKITNVYNVRGYSRSFNSTLNECIKGLGQSPDFLARMKRDIDNFLEIGEFGFGLKKAEFINGSFIKNGKLITETDFENDIYITKNQRQVIKQLDYISYETLSVDEKNSLLNGLIFCFGSHFGSCSAFIMQGMMDKNVIRPTFWVEGSPKCGKTTICYIIASIGNFEPDVECQLTSFINFVGNEPSLFKRRFNIVDDANFKRVEDKFAMLDEIKRFSTSRGYINIPCRYTVDGLTVKPSVYLMLTSVDNYESIDDQQIIERSKRILIPAHTQKYKKHPYVGNADFYRKASGFYVYLINDFLTNFKLPEDIQIEKRLDFFTELMYYLQSKFGEDVVRLDDYLKDVDVCNVEQIWGDFLVWVVQQKPMKRTDIYEEFRKHESGLGVDIVGVYRLSSSSVFWRKFLALTHNNMIEFGDISYTFEEDHVKLPNGKRPFFTRFFISGKLEEVGQKTLSGNDLRLNRDLYDEIKFGLKNKMGFTEFDVDAFLRDNFAHFSSVYYLSWDNIKECVDWFLSQDFAFNKKREEKNESKGGI